MVHFMNVLFPLYVYPTGCATTPNTTACAWFPLYQQAQAFPNMQFTVVVNPNSGPGSTACPDTNYIGGIAFMNKYKNIKKIGYVDSAEAGRAASAYQKDLKTYAGWNTTTCKSDIHLDGIFIDDVNNANTTTNQAYYKTLSGAVNSTMPAGKNFLMLNPGAPMALPFFNYADSIITYEGYYTGIDQKDTIFNSSTTYKNTPRQKQAVIVHDFNGTAAQQQQLSDRMGETEAMGWFFLTNKTQATNPYGSFPGMWQQMVTAVNATDSWMAQHPQWYS